MKRKDKSREVHEGEIDSYANDVLDPYKWIETARGLQLSANLLRPTVLIFWTKVELASQNKRLNPFPEPPLHVLATYNLLLAFAIENLFKALFVRQNYDELRSRLRKPELPSDLKGNHDLVALAKKTRMYSEMRDVLRTHLHTLSTIAKWCGRYPIPIHAADLRSGGLAVGPNDANEGNEICKEIFVRFKKCPRSRNAPIILPPVVKYGWGPDQQPIKT